MFDRNILPGGEPRFRAGDKVVFRRDITIGDRYESPWSRRDFTSFYQEKESFLKLHDYTATIERINEYGFYQLEGDDGEWHFPDCWVMSLHEESTSKDVEVDQNDLLALIGG